MCLIHALGGAFKHQPEELVRKLSDQSSDLIKRAFEDVDPDFVLKRTLKHPATSKPLPASLFMFNPALSV